MEGMNEQKLYISRTATNAKHLK